MKEYKLVEYEFLGTNGKVVMNANITDENEIKEICVKDYLDSNIKIIEKEGK